MSDRRALETRLSNMNANLQKNTADLEKCKTRQEAVRTEIDRKSTEASQKAKLRDECQEKVREKGAEVSEKRERMNNLHRDIRDKTRALSELQQRHLAMKTRVETCIAESAVIERDIQHMRDKLEELHAEKEGLTANMTSRQYRDKMHEEHLSSARQKQYKNDYNQTASRR